MYNVATLEAKITKVCNVDCSSYINNSYVSDCFVNILLYCVLIDNPECVVHGVKSMQNDRSSQCLEHRSSLPGGKRFKQLDTASKIDLPAT